MKKFKLFDSLLAALVVVTILVTAFAGSVIAADDTTSRNSVTESMPIFTVSSVSEATYNDISIPLPEYPAYTGQNWTMRIPTASSFQNKDGSCKSYGNSNECDGFARYAHDRYWHMDASNWGKTWSKSSGDYHDGIDWDNSIEANRATEKAKVVAFFESLSVGAFVRYGKDDDVSPGDGAHSIFFNGNDENGIWVYECNQDAFLDNDPSTHCGVGYQYCTFDHIYTEYDYVFYYVDHALDTPVFESVTYHTVDCANCAGYLRQTHSASEQKTGYDLQQHKISYGCCSDYILENHTDTSPTIQQYNSLKHRRTYDCCGVVYENHDFKQEGSSPGATMECKICDYSILINKTDPEHEIE